MCIWKIVENMRGKIGKNEAELGLAYSRLSVWRPLQNIFPPSFGRLLGCTRPHRHFIFQCWQIYVVTKAYPGLLALTLSYFAVYKKPTVCVAQTGYYALVTMLALLICALVGVALGAMFFVRRVKLQVRNRKPPFGFIQRKSISCFIAHTLTRTGTEGISTKKRRTDAEMHICLFKTSLGTFRESLSCSLQIGGRMLCLGK